MEDRDRFQYEHITFQIVKEGLLAGIPWEPILDDIRDELDNHGGEYEEAAKAYYNPPELNGYNPPVPVKRKLHGQTDAIKHVVVKRSLGHNLGTPKSEVIE